MIIEYNNNIDKTISVVINDSDEENIDTIVIEPKKDIFLNINLNAKVKKLVFSEGIETIQGSCIMAHLDEIVFPTSIIKLGNKNKLHGIIGCFNIDGLIKLDLSHCLKLYKLEYNTFLCQDLEYINFPNTSLQLENSFIFTGGTNLKKVDFPTIVHKQNYKIFTFYPEGNLEKNLERNNLHLLTDIDTSLGLINSIDSMPNLKILRAKKFDQNIIVPRNCLVFLANLSSGSFMAYGDKPIILKVSNELIINISYCYDIPIELNITYDVFDKSTGKDLYKLHFAGKSLTRLEQEIVLNQIWNTPDYIESISFVILNLHNIKNMSIVINTLTLLEKLEDGHPIKTDFNKALFKSYFNRRFKKLMHHIVKYESDCELLSFLAENNYITKTNITTYIKNSEFENIQIDIKNKLISLVL